MYSAAKSLKSCLKSQTINSISELSNPEDTVQLEAATALKFRGMNADTFESQKRVFLIDSAVSVRLAVLDNLWQAHEKFPEAYKLVKRAAVKDGSKDVRKASTNIIAKYPKSD